MPDRGLGLPEAVFPEEGIEEDREPAHDRDESDLVRLAFDGEALVVSPEGRFATRWLRP